MTKPRIILVVEDSALILMNAVSMLQDAGFETLEAINADKAIVILETRTDISLVFTDVTMPGTMDGLTLVACIRNRWPPIKLLVVSGNAIIGESNLPAGARFIRKPYANENIVETINDLLREPA